MKAQSYFGVASRQVTTQPCHVLKIEGDYQGAADGFIQVHDSAGVPADGVVPLKSWPVGAGSAASPTPFFQSFTAGELALSKGLYVCVSSTLGTKTLSASVMDLQVELAGPEEPSGLTVAGDLDTEVDHLQVWADAAGPKSLVKLELGDPDEALTDDSYAQVFAQDAPEDGDEPLCEFIVEKGSAVRTLSFGQGRIPWSLAADGKTARDGCTIWISDTPGVLTKTAGSCLVQASCK